MLHLNKNISNQKGLTLVELLAVLVLTAIVSTFLISITTKALENTRIISQETVLRDEADLIVTKFINTLYSTKQEYIIRNTITVGGNSYLEVTNDLSKCRRNESGVLINENECNKTLQPVGFKTANGMTKIHIFNEEYKIENNRIRILPSSKINGNPETTNVYEIVLALSITHTRGNSDSTKEMVFKNEIQPIVKYK